MTKPTHLGLLLIFAQRLKMQSPVDMKGSTFSTEKGQKMQTAYQEGMTSLDVYVILSSLQHSKVRKLDNNGSALQFLLLSLFSRKNDFSAN